MSGLQPILGVRMWGEEGSALMVHGGLVVVGCDG